MFSTYYILTENQSAQFWIVKSQSDRRTQLHRLTHSEDDLIGSLMPQISNNISQYTCSPFFIVVSWYLKVILSIAPMAVPTNFKGVSDEYAHAFRENI